MNFVRNDRSRHCFLIIPLSYSYRTFTQKMTGKAIEFAPKIRRTSYFQLLNKLKFKNFETKNLYGPILVTCKQKNAYLTKLEKKKCNILHSKKKKKFDEDSTFIFGPMQKIKYKNCESIYSNQNMSVESEKLLSTAKEKFINVKIKNMLEKSNAVAQQKLPHSNAEVCRMESKIDNDLNCNGMNMPATNHEVNKLSHKLCYKIIDFPLFSDHFSNYANKLILTPMGLFQRSENKLPSVTTILKATMSRENLMSLEQWKQQMILKLGEEGFLKYNQETLHDGVALHDRIKELLSGKPKTEIFIEPANEGHWHSLAHVFEDISCVKVLESKVQHPFLHYAGIVDCIADYKGNLCLIDWKTSQKPKLHLKSTFDTPLQTSAYLGAINFDKNYNYRVENALIVIAYASGNPAHAHLMPRNICLYYWNQWLKRLQLYWELKLKEQKSLQ